MSTEIDEFHCDSEEWSRLIDRLLNRPVPHNDEDHGDESEASSSYAEQTSTTSVKDDDIDNCSQAEESHPIPMLSSKITSYDSSIHLENLPPDASSLILSHVHPCDLHNFSLTSHKCYKMFCNETLWRWKFRDRWNCLVDRGVGSEDGGGGFWRQAYVAAHNNPHDLWIRHWNCVFPEDVTACPGRTVVPNLFGGRNARGNTLGIDSEEKGSTDTNESQHRHENEYNAAALKLCPTCRYHPMLHNGYNSDIAQAVHNELEYSNQTMESSESIAGESDPVHNAEVVAAAHSLLANKRINAEMNNRLPDGLESTVARTIHYSSMYSVAKWCRNVRLVHGETAAVAATENETINSSLLHRFHNQLSKKKQCDDTSTSRQAIQNKAIYAFERASTYNRCIDTDQYQSTGLNFLTDALFFNIHPSYQKERTTSSKWRSRIGLNDATARTKYDSAPLDELLHDLNQLNAHVPSPHSLSSLGTKFETAHHSWHIIRLTNPDYVRPITFRCYIQCPEAFTVFPSQGYLRAGETVHLVLGVRMSGSLLNEAFEAIDVERGEADPSFTTLYAERGHLPLVPFAIRYIFAPCIPCLPHDFTARPDNQSRSAFAPTNPQQPRTKFQSALDHLWDTVSAEADVRTIPISGHVNSNYSLDELQNATLMPFNLAARSALVESPSNLPLTTVMPNLKERSPQLFSLIQNLGAELGQTYAGDCYRTEKCCLQCKRDWGPQSEILGRAYILRRLDIERHALIRSQHQADFLKAMLAIPLMLKRSLLDDQSSHNVPSRGLLSKLNRIRQLLYIGHTDVIKQKRADKLLQTKEWQLFSACEMYLDETYTDLQNCIRVIESKTGSSKDATNRPWRTSGVYNNVRCSDWVLPGRQSSGDKSCKPEPDHLRQFGLMEYNPGGFNLGRQDDPNHECFQTYLGCQPPLHTDMFHNNATKGFISALAMIGKPECLVGHGVYDRVEKPGAVIRCPSQPCDVFFRTFSKNDVDLARQAVNLIMEWGTKCTQRKFSLGGGRGEAGWSGINFEMNDCDPDGLSVVTFGLKDFVVNFQTTMAHYISNIPLPGQGKLLLSSPPGDHERGCGIISLYTRVQPYSKIIFPSQSEDLKNIQGSSVETSTGRVAPNQPHPNGIEDGINFPELNIVWLIARHLGITVDDDRSRGAILVDRRILIAVQWFSNTIMVFSLLASLLSRKFRLVKSIPADFHFFGSPIQLSNNDMRFWTAEECGFAALIVFGFYFVLGRLSERNISRSYDREMRDSIEERPPSDAGIMYRAIWRMSQFAQRLWDNICPLFLQMRIFMPTWNKRGRQEILQNITFKRSKDNREHRSLLDANNGRGRMSVAFSRQLGFWSYIIGLSFALLSFSACSPHFVVNSLTVFCCSLAFGMSMSVESLENVRRTTSTGVLSMVKPRRLNTLVIGFILIGQLVGGSGGIIFLAEFVVTTVCLILGGAATITSRAVESWITFLCLASTAFWGFVFARLGLLDAIRKRRRGIPSALLCASLCSSFLMWVGVFTRVDWEALTPGDVVLIQAHQLLTMVRERWQNRG